MKKSIFLALVVALVAMMSISAYAEVSFDFKLETHDEANGVYKIAAYATDTDTAYDAALQKEVNGNFRALQAILTYDSSIFVPYSWEYSETADIVNYPTDPFKPMTESTRKKAVFASVSYETEGTMTTATADSYYTPANEAAYVYPNNLAVLEFYFTYATGKSAADITSESFTVDYLSYGNINFNYYGHADAEKNNIAVTNSVVPTPAATLEIDVLAGDTVYEGDQITEVAEAGKYTVTATEGYVIVNSGYTAQKVYEVKNGGVSEVTALADGVVTQDAVGIRSDSEDTTGIRFKSHFTLAAKAQFVEAGVVVGVEKGRTYDNSTLVVGGANTKTGIAYNSTTDIYLEADTTKQVVTAVATGIPVNASNVKVKIAVRPYYKLENGTIVYGEIVRKTAYEAAYSIKNAADQTKYEANKEYVDSILAAGDSVGQGDTIVDVGKIFGIN